MPAVKNVGEPCAREPHARFEVAAGGNQTSRASTRRAVQAPPADPTTTGLKRKSAAANARFSFVASAATRLPLLLSRPAGLKEECEIGRQARRRNPWFVDPEARRVRSHTSSLARACNQRSAALTKPREASAVL
jgi:hypothetical protein